MSVRRRVVAGLLFVLLCAAPVGAQAVHDASATGTYASGTTFTWNHTFAAGAIAGICVGYKFNALEAITGVTVGGSAATFVSRVSNAGGGPRVEFWKHESPASGSQAIVVTFDGNLGTDSGAAHGISLSVTGASGWASGTTAGPTSSTTPSVTIGSLGANDMPYACVLAIADPTQQDTAILEATGTGMWLNAQRQATGGDGVLNWTQGTSDEWLVVGSRAIASGGGGATAKRGTLVGVLP